MLLPSAWVGPSKIHGLGLIAAEFIPCGTVVWRLEPSFDIPLTQQQLDKLPAIAQLNIRHYGYFDERLERFVLSGDDDRFTNHADDADVRFCGDHAMAVRDIRPGEEITDSYAELGKSLDAFRYGVVGD
jgi:SET domain-containing protein